MDSAGLQEIHKQHRRAEDSGTVSRLHEFLRLIHKKQKLTLRQHKAKFNDRGECLLEIPPSKVKRMTDEVNEFVKSLDDIREQAEMTLEDTASRYMQAFPWKQWLPLHTSAFMQQTMGTLNNQEEKFKRRVDEFTKLLVRSLHRRHDYNTPAEEKVVDVLWELQEHIANVSGKAEFPPLEALDCPELENPGKFFNDAFRGAYQEMIDNDDGKEAVVSPEGADDVSDATSVTDATTTSRTHSAAMLGGDTASSNFSLLELSTHQTTIIFTLLMDRVGLARICAVRRERAGIAHGRAIGDRLLAQAMRLILRVLGFLRLEGLQLCKHVGWGSHVFTCLLAQSLEALRFVIDAASICSPWLLEAFEQDAAAFVPVVDVLGGPTVSLEQHNKKVGRGRALETGHGLLVLAEHLNYWTEQFITIRRVSHLLNVNGLVSASGEVEAILHPEYVGLQHIVHVGSPTVIHVLRATHLILASAGGVSRSVGNVAGVDAEGTGLRRPTSRGGAPGTMGAPGSRGGRRGNINMTPLAGGTLGVGGTHGGRDWKSSVKSIYLELLNSALALATTGLDRYMMRVNGFAVDHGNLAEYMLVAHLNDVVADNCDTECLTCMQVAYVAAALGHYSGAFLGIIERVRDLTLSRRFDTTLATAFATTLNTAIISCYQRLEVSYPDAHGWLPLDRLTQAPLTAESLLDGFSKDEYVNLRGNVNKYVDTCILNLWNARLSPMACTQNLLAIRLLLNQTLMSKNKIDTVLSRGEEDDDDRDYQMPDYAELSESEASLKKTVFMQVFKWYDVVLQKLYPNNNQIMLKVPSMMERILALHAEEPSTMEQWMLCALHLCRASNLGLAGLREAAHGNLVPLIKKMALYHSHNAYLRALNDMVVEDLTVMDD